MLSPAPTSVFAASQVASVANAALADSGLPPFVPALAPAVSPETGLEAMPSAYAIPVAHRLERAARHVISHQVEVALLLILEVPEGDSPEDRAQEWLAMLQGAVEAVLAAGGAEGVKFIDADIVEPADPELLAQSGIFRSQANVSCMVLVQQ